MSESKTKTESKSKTEIKDKPPDDFYRCIKVPLKSAKRL